jgi:5-methylcytosine-specific restriction endonuclease McrA
MRLCSGPGCGRKVPDDVRFCDECKAERGTSGADEIRTHHTPGVYDEVLDGLRKGTRWQSIRKRVIQRDPLCKRCQLAVSEIADHIVPAAVAIAQAQESGRYPYDKYAGYYLLSNLQGLCRSCHAVKTLEDKAHVGPWPDVVAAEGAAPKKVWTF